VANQWVDLWKQTMRAFIRWRRLAIRTFPWLGWQTERKDGSSHPVMWETKATE
jgi:hypothetical protein